MVSNCTGNRARALSYAPMVVSRIMHQDYARAWALSLDWIIFVVSLETYVCVRVVKIACVLVYKLIVCVCLYCNVPLLGYYD